jgi:hypothetical protein
VDDDEAIELYVRREDAERFLTDVRADDEELGRSLRLESDLRRRRLLCCSVACDERLPLRNDLAPAGSAERNPSCDSSGTQQ